MIEASKLRAGMTFVTSDGKLIKVLEASHHKPGKGNTVMRMKLRDVRTGSTFDTNYRQKKNSNKLSSKHVLHNTFIQNDMYSILLDTSYEQYESQLLT